MNRSFCAVVILFLLLLARPSISTSDDLSDVLTSPEYRNAFRDKKVLKIPADIDPESRYIHLFDIKAKKSPVFVALGEDLQGFRLSHASQSHRDEYVMVNRTFTPVAGRGKVTVTVVLPHPAYLNMVRDGLVLSIKNLRPDSSTVSSKGQVEIGGEVGELIQLKDGRTYYFINLPREVILMAYSETAGGSTHLRPVVEQLNITALKHEILN